MRQKRNGSHLILIELMFVLFFFAICGAILLQVFVKSHNISVKAKELTETKNYVTQAAELFEAGYSKVNEYEEYFPYIKENDEGYQVFFDKDFHMSKEKKAVYQMTIQIRDGKADTKGEIIMTKNKKQLYHLELIRHLPGGKKNEKS